MGNNHDLPCAPQIYPMVFLLQVVLLEKLSDRRKQSVNKRCPFFFKGGGWSVSKCCTHRCLDAYKYRPCVRFVEKLTTLRHKRAGARSLTLCLDMLTRPVMLFRCSHMTTVSSLVLPRFRQTEQKHLPDVLFPHSSEDVKMCLILSTNY